MVSVMRFILIFLFLLSPRTQSEADDPNYLGHFCLSTIPENISNTFQIYFAGQIQNLFTGLSSYAGYRSEHYGAAEPGFNLSRIHPGSNPVVYGLFSCRADLPTAKCKHWVDFAIKDVTHRCPIEKYGEAVIWYNECLLMYSPRSNFSTTMMVMPRRIFSNAQNAADPIKFDENVTSALTQLLYLTSARMDRFVELAWYDRLYGLAQCTPQISFDDCSTCIGDVIAEFRSCCSGKTGARVITPSCYVRYDVFPFYNLPDSPPTLSAPTLSAAKSRGKWIQIAGISAVVLVLVLYNYFALIFWRSKKDSNKDVPLPFLGQGSLK